MNMKKASKRGQSLVEYGLVLALIAVLAILVIKAVGVRTACTFDTAQSQMTAQGVSGGSPTGASS
ncbi:MAG: Flp family type IVb pilin [Verrucomicrobiia bacterium]